MKRVFDVWRGRLLWIAFELLSIIPPFLHYRVVQERIYNIRIAGGLHPVEILSLRYAGQR
jgi:hypothetical protein